MNRPIDPDLDDNCRLHSLDRDGLERRCRHLARELAEERTENRALRKQLKRAQQHLKSIVVTEGCDSGVILISDASPTDWDEEHQVQVYRHEHFSPLGDALVVLHEILVEK